MSASFQVDVRTLEAAPEADPADFAPAMRRDADELDGFLEFLAAEVIHPGLADVVKRFLSDDAMRASLQVSPRTISTLTLIISLVDLDRV